MKKTLKSAAVFLAAIMILLITAAAASAAGEVSFGDRNGEIIGISDRGLWHEYPENSVQAIRAAVDTGIDYILADVSRTSDGAFVLIENSSSGRMLGAGAGRKISDFTLAELKSLPLKNRSGGQNNEITDYFVPSVEELLLPEFEKKIILKTDALLCEDLAAFLAEKNASGFFGFYITGKDSDVQAAAGVFEDSLILTEKKSNIVFVITSFIEKMRASGADAVVLKTTNRYGVDFNQTVLKHFRNGIAAASATSDSRTAGAREDTQKWWDDLISRGYSVIITGNPALFSEYRAENAAAREKLAVLAEKYIGGEWVLPQFGEKHLNDFKKAYDDAAAQAGSLLEDKSSSTQDMNDCAAALQKACDDIDFNYTEIEEGVAGKTVNLKNILLCVLAAALVIPAEVYCYKKRKKD